jgi:PhnB protein
MQAQPYLSFNGNCAEAFKFYAETFGGKIIFMQTYGDSPMGAEMPEEARNNVMHATLDLNGGYLMGADAGEHYATPQGFSLSLNFDNAAEAERIYNVLAENGSVQMPLQETFWAERFGMMTDRFGTPWMVNCEGAKAEANKAEQATAE